MPLSRRHWPGFHEGAVQGWAIDACGTVNAISARWQENLDELHRYADAVLAGGSAPRGEAAGSTVHRWPYGSVRPAHQRPPDGRRARRSAPDDIFCMPGGPVVLDCLEFDDDLRHVDGSTTQRFSRWTSSSWVERISVRSSWKRYRRRCSDNAPAALMDFYIAYRAVVRRKVDCVRIARVDTKPSADARRHLDMALDRLESGTMRLVLLGRGPGTGKTTLAPALAEQIRAQVARLTMPVGNCSERTWSTEPPMSSTPGSIAPRTSPPCTSTVLRRARLYLGRRLVGDPRRHLA